MDYPIKEEYKKIVNKEGGYRAFECKGLKCRVIRVVHTGCLNGYVGVPKDHAAFGKESYSCECSKGSVEEGINNIEVHGGLTYEGDNLYMQPEKDLRWFGFDTNHLGDLSPISNEYNISNGIYRTKEYVISEVEKLAKQLYKLTDGGSIDKMIAEVKRVGEEQSKI